LTSWSWEECCETLINTHWRAFVCEHMKTKLYSAWYLQCRGLLSCPLSRLHRSNFDIIIAWDHLNLEEEPLSFGSIFT
jgi:hypothetical protein